MRQSDSPKWWVASAIGVLFIVSGVVLKLWSDLGDWPCFAIIGLGALMLRPDYVVDLVRIWRKGGGSTP